MATSTTLTAAKLKAIIKKEAGNGKYGRGPTFYIGKVGEDTYATDSHWMAPVERVRPLLDHYNLSGDVGTYVVNGTVTKEHDDSPKMDVLLARHEDAERIGAEPVKIAGRLALVNVQDDDTAIVCRSAEGAHYGIRTDFLSVIVGTDWANRLEIGEVVLVQTADNGNLHAVGVYIITKSTSYTINPTRHNVWHTVSPVALVMPVRF